MILSIAILIFVPWTTDGINADEIKNKTKRTLSQELFNYGENKPFYVYSDNLGSHSTSRELPNLPSGSKSLTLVSTPQVLKVYDQQVSPKVAPQPQQLIYEYPVPQNTVPNVQVRHFIQPFNNFNPDFTAQNTQIPDYKEISPANGNSFVPSETVVLPVQQRQNAALVSSNNGQPYSNIRFHSINSAQTVPRKYFFVNGKIIYDQNHLPYYHQNINQPQHPLLAIPNQQLPYYPQQRSERPPIINYVNRNHTPRLNLNTPPANVSPITYNDYNRLSAPPKKQLPPITNSLSFPHKNNEQNEQETEEKTAPVREKEENEEDSEEKSNDQEEDFDQHEQNPIFNKYSFDDYEENDHNDYRDHKEVQDDEDEEDNKRGSTKRVTSKKYPRKYLKGGKYSSDYRYNDPDSKYENSDVKSYHKSNKKPKMVYKSVKYSREINSKPKGDFIEGRPSENVPVTHKHNRVFKEKWYISKTDENLEAK